MCFYAFSFFGVGSGRDWNFLLGAFRIGVAMGIRMVMSGRLMVSGLFRAYGGLFRYKEDGCMDVCLFVCYL